MTQNPRPIYSGLLEQRRAEIARFDRRHRTLGYYKLAAAVGGVLIVWAALLNRAISILWILAPIALLVAFSVTHELLLRRLDQRRRAERYFEKALARLDGKWAGTGEPGDRYLDPAHPYAQDLDLFGKGSLFELLCTARERMGPCRIIAWTQ